MASFEPAHVISYHAWHDAQCTHRIEVDRITFERLVLIAGGSENWQQVLVLERFKNLRPLTVKEQ